jgi:hypothetical protein
MAPVRITSRLFADARSDGVHEHDPPRLIVHDALPRARIGAAAASACSTALTRAAARATAAIEKARNEGPAVVVREAGPKLAHARRLPVDQSALGALCRRRVDLRIRAKGFRTDIGAKRLAASSCSAALTRAAARRGAARAARRCSSGPARAARRCSSRSARAARRGPAARAGLVVVVIVASTSNK